MKKLILVIFAFCLPLAAFGHDKGHDWGSDASTTVVNNTYINQSFTRLNQTGVASAIAQAQIARDWNTTRLQVGIGAGRFEGNTAFAIGGAFKTCNDCLMFTGSIARENGVTSAGVGLNFRF